MILTLLFAVPALAQHAPVVIDLINVDSTAWKVSQTSVAGVAELGVPNPVLHLSVGTRYHFVNHGTIRVHPLALRGRDTQPLLGQRPDSRPFEEDPGVAFVADDSGLTFTLTAALARELATYYCTAHPAPLMEGNVEVNMP